MPTTAKAGTVTGTGAVLNVSLGFNPDAVTVTNDTTGDEIVWYSNMGAGHGFRRAATGARTKITTGGISLYLGNALNQAGFTIGIDALNANGNVLRYHAVSNGPGAN